MKNEKPPELKFSVPALNFEEIPWINEEMIAKGIYLRYKVIGVVVNATGDYHVKCGFPPRTVQAKVQDNSQQSIWDTDFTTTFSIRTYNSGWTVGTTESSTLTSLSTLIGSQTIRYTDGFNFNVATYSGSAKTVYFSCYS